MTALRAAYDELAGGGVDLLTHTELLEVLDELETLCCQLPTQSQRLLARLQAETTCQELGAKSWRDVLMIRWRLSSKEANRRLAEATDLAPRHTLSGEPLPPLLPATSTAQGLGMLTREHVTVIRTALTKLPGWVTPAERGQIEVDWVRHGVGMGPKELADQTARTLFTLDQDGPLPTDEERARRRGVSIGRQGADGMTQLSANLDPQGWAAWEVLFAKFAAPGMCNPADETPCTSGTPSQAQIDSDIRTLAQRRHDAMVFIGRAALHKGELGHLCGLPTSIIVRTTLAELRDRAGIGVTGGGTMIPVSDVLSMAAGRDAHNYLAVFDEATGSVLDLFHTRRTASVAQRLALIARDGGCSKPGCTVPAYGTQVHHVVTDWADGGNTNVDENGLACGPDNRMVAPNGWTTRMNEHHQVEWLPPPRLDTGQARVNHYHHPETLRQPTEYSGAPANSPAAPAPPVTPTPPATATPDEPGIDRAVIVDRAATVDHPRSGDQPPPSPPHPPPASRKSPHHGDDPPGDPPGDPRPSSQSACDQPTSA